MADQLKKHIPVLEFYDSSNRPITDPEECRRLIKLVAGQVGAEIDAGVRSGELSAEGGIRCKWRID